MDLNTRKERFSLAYINAVATSTNCEVLEPQVDRGSVDGFLVGPARGRDLIRFQAKATEQHVMRDNRRHFPLSIRDYDNLRTVVFPFVLIVVLAPNDETQWLTQTDEEFCLRHCGYWMPLVGRPEVSNINSMTVHKPTANVFGSSGLTDLMDKVARGEPL